MDGRGVREWRRVGGLIPSCEAKIGVPDNGSKTEPIVKCDSLIHDLDAFRGVKRKRLEQFAHGRKLAAFPQSGSDSDRQSKRASAKSPLSSLAIKSALMSGENDG